MADNNSVPNNIYTVLVLVALVVLLGGLVFVIMRSNELFGTWNPMEAKPLNSAAALLPVNLPTWLG